MFSYKDAREYVKKEINGKSATIIGYFILCSIFKSILSAIIGSQDWLIMVVTSSMIAGLTTPIQTGFYRIMINIMNKKEVKFAMLFEDYKYFTNLFVIGVVCNLIINVANKILLLGIILNFVYVGILYLFIYNSDLSLSDFVNKAKEKIKLYLGECIILELSYIWPLIVAGLIYGILFVILLILVLAGNINTIANLKEVGELVKLIESAIPILVLSILFAIIVIVMAIMILPRLLLAEAKFYAVFADDSKSSKDKKSYCPSCGTKIEGKFCSNCGNKNE